MHYRPDVGFHGTIETKIEINDLVREPSLTLCDLQNFGYWGGAISHCVFREASQTSAFKRMAARAQVDPTVSLRVSTYTVWLDTGQVPSARPDWHIDRVGSSYQVGTNELIDLRDPFEFPCFILVTAFIPDISLDADALNQVSTEFLLTTVSGPLPALGIDDSRKVHQEIHESLVSIPKIATVHGGDRMIVSFSPRTVHRPGKACSPGWRYMLRIGLYTASEPCSPYADHFIISNPVWDSSTASVVFRKIGQKGAYSLPIKRSMHLLGDRDMIQTLVEEQGLSVGLSAGTDAIQRLV